MKLYHRGASALALVACVTLTASCGHPVKPAAAGRPTIGFVYGSTQANFATEMARGYVAGAAKVGGVDVRTDAPSIVDGPREIEMLDAMANSAKGGIAVHAVVNDLFAQPMAKIAAQGIPLMAVDGIPSAGSGAHLLVANDNYQLGTLLAEQMVRRLPANASGTIVAGSPQPGAAVLDTRIQAVRDVLKNRLPHVRVLGPFATGREPQENLAVWRTLVKANPNALLFFGVGDFDASNLGRLHKETGGRWLAGGFDLIPDAVEAVRSGDLIGLVSPEHFLKGAVAGEIQARAAKSGTPLPKGWVLTPGLLVTAANAQEIIQRQASDASRAAWFAPQIAEIVDHLDKHTRSLDEVR